MGEKMVKVMWTHLTIPSVIESLLCCALAMIQAHIQ
jgi:hypothetical protein